MIAATSRDGGADNKTSLLHFRIDPSLRQTDVKHFKIMVAALVHFLAGVRRLLVRRTLNPSQGAEPSKSLVLCFGMVN